MDFPQWSSVLARILVKTEIKARKQHADMVDEMVTEAQSLVPVRSGKLKAGITREQDGDAVLFVATAEAASDGADYARIEEFGSGDSGLYAGSGASTSAYNRPRPSRGRGSGKPAQPYYLPALHSVLDRHGKDMDGVMIGAGEEEGF